MDRYLTILQPTTTRNSVGDPTTTWSTLGVIAAEILQQSSREFRASLAIRSETEYVFRVRYNTQITGDMRVQYEGRTLELLGDPDEDTARGRREWMLLRAARVKGV